MDKLAVVILNYESYWDTINCVRSLTNQTYSDFSIIIVDNGSSNNSLEELTKIQREIQGIQIIRAKRNLGFANGNNLGILHARAYGISNVLLANSDIVFTDTFLLEKLMTARENDVGLIGPKIFLPDNTIQEFFNPVPSYANICREIYKRQVYLWIERHPKIKKIYRMFKPEMKEIYHGNGVSDSPIKSSELVLHGCCFLLTNRYFDYYKMLWPGTFLYHEEYILSILLNKCNLCMKYVPHTSVLHKDGRSTKVLINDDEKRATAKRKWYYESELQVKKVYKKKIKELQHIIADFNLKEEVEIQ